MAKTKRIHKADFLKQVADKAGMSVADIRKVNTALGETMVEVTENGLGVEVADYIICEPVHRKAVKKPNNFAKDGESKVINVPAKDVRKTSITDSVKVIKVY